MPNLPAPYVSPWKEFARNLRALWADLGLRGQELWRRNREGGGAPARRMDENLRVPNRLLKS